MTFQDGKVNIKGKSYSLTSIDSIVVVPEITVTYNGSSAEVCVPKSIQKDVTVSVNQADVTITNNNVSNEFDVILSGSSSNGSLTYNGQYKASFYLNGLNLTSQKGSPLDIECGKRIALILQEGTTNSLTDAASGNQKACLYCKGHLEVEGAGTLNITANAKHGIGSKEYLQLKKSCGTINFVKAMSDAIHTGQYFQMNGGTINIDANTKGDGIQVETLMLSDDKTIDTSKEENGKVFIKGGTIKAAINSEDCKGIKCDNDIAISGGTISIDANGNGSRGIQTDGSMTITDGTITINAKGGLCTATACEDDPHRCMGIKIESNFTVSGGDTTVTNTGKKSRGIKVGGSYSKTGGTVNANITQ